MEASIEVELTNHLIIGYSSLHGSNPSSRAAFTDPARPPPWFNVLLSELFH